MTNQPPSRGARLTGALTGAQLTALLDVLLDALDEAQVADLSSHLDPDTGKVLASLFQTKQEKKREVLSEVSLMKQWRTLWNRWDNVVGEVGDEDGEYAFIDEDWESPYFASDALAEDLDEIARDMFPLLASVHELGDEEADVFVNALAELADAIEEYPEWMGGGEEYCYLEPTTTRCLLQWEWLNAEHGDEPGRVLVNTLVDIDQTLNFVYWHEDTLVEFFLELPEAVRKDIFNYFTQLKGDPAWESRLESDHSEWARIYQEYELIDTKP